MSNLIADSHAISPRPMARLLEELGFLVNERTHRARCIFCSAHNATTLSWCEDGRWHCFRCHAGGDRIDLVKAVKNCPFLEAVDFLAVLAGVKFCPGRVSAPQIERARLERKRSKTLRAHWWTRNVLRGAKRETTLMTF